MKKVVKNIWKKRKYVTIISLLAIVILSPLLYFAFHPKEVKAEWWNESWLFRKAINIPSHSTSENNVYVTVPSFDATDATHFQADCGDLRFTKQNGEVLPYFVVDCDATATIHVQFDTLPAGATTYYMYYGNSTAINGFESADFSTAASGLGTLTLATEEKSPGPVGYWKFEEGTGTTAQDSTAFNHDGPITGATWETESSCVSGKCMSFDGSDYVNPTGVQVNTTVGQTNTVEFWMKWGGTSTQMPFSWGGGNYDLFLHNNCFGFNTYQGNIFGFSSVGLANTWVHVAAVFYNGVPSASNSKIYINGVEKALTSCYGSTTLSKSATTSVNIGGDTSYRFGGYIDEVKIFPYTRSAAQIKSDYIARGTSKDTTVTVGANSTNSTTSMIDPIAHYKFDEGSQTIAHDSSANRIDSSAFGGAPAWTTGKWGKSLNFDVTDDYVQINRTASLEPASAITVTAWIKKDGYPGAVKYLISKEKDRSSGSYAFYTSSGGLAFYVGTNTYHLSPISTAVWDNNWHHIAGVYNGSTVSLYIDGISAGTPTSATGNIAYDTSKHLFFNIYGTSYTGYFGGQLDEVKIYNYALTADEVKQDMNQGSFTVMGASSSSTNQEYCVPGDTSSCTAPIAEWKMDEGSGLYAQDTSGSGNVGTLGVGTSAPTWISGKVGKALSFDGADDYIQNTTSLGTQITNGYTFSFWMKPTAAGSDASPIGLIANAAAPTIQLRTSDFRFFPDGASSYTGGSYTLNNWSHVALVYNESNYYFYINGSLITSGSDTTGVPSDTDTYFIGSNDSSSRFFKGIIDQVIIYNYARTPAQIAWDYNRGAPVGYWKLDECQGTVANDASGNGNNGTITIGAGETNTSVGTCNGSAGQAWKDGATGKLNASLEFDGVDDYVQMGANTVTGSNPFTLTAWMKAGSHSTYGLGFYIGGANTAASAWIGWCDTAQHGTSDSIGGGFYGTNYGSGITDTNWHLVTLTFSGGSNGTAILYVDGIKTVTDTFTPNLASTSVMMGKANSSTAYWYNGQVDEARIYNYALTASQIKDLYVGGSVRFGN